MRNSPTQPPYSVEKYHKRTGLLVLIAFIHPNISKKETALQVEENQ